MRKVSAGIALVGRALAAFAAVATAEGPKSAPTRTSELQRALEDLVAAGAPGATLLLGEGDPPYASRAAMQTREARRPMRSADRFPVGRRPVAPGAPSQWTRDLGPSAPEPRVAFTATQKDGRVAGPRLSRIPIRARADDAGFRILTVT